MTNNGEKITQIIFGVVNEMNLDLPSEEQIEGSKEAVLFGSSGGLSSLGFVKLVVAIEDKIEKEFKVNIDLTDNETMSKEKSPFETLGTLSDHISSLMIENHGT